MDDYHRASASKLGVRSECRACKSKTDAVYSKLNSAKRTETSRLWRLKYPERHKQHVKNSNRRARERKKVGG